MDEEILEEEIAVTGISLSSDYKEVDLSSGEVVFLLTATITPENATNKNIIWNVSDPNKVAIDNGSVTCLEPGNVIITAITEDGGFSSNCEVEITASILSVELSQHILVANAGDTIQLTATINPSYTTDDTTLTWESSNPEACTVSDTGFVEFFTNGISSIIVTTTNGKQDICYVNTQVYPRSISVYPEEEQFILNESEPLTLEVIFTPENTTERDIQWESSDNNIATVDAEGHVLCNSIGFVKITAEDVRDHTAFCYLEVYSRFSKPNPPTVDEVYKNEIVITPAPGCSYSLDGVNFFMNNRVSGLTHNTVYNIYQRRYTSGYYLQSEPSDPIQVRTNDITHVTGVVLTEHEVTVAVTEGSITSYKLYYNIFPSDADIKTVLWSSSDTSIVTVNSEGVVSVIAEGIVTITATTTEGGFSDSCEIIAKARWEKPDRPTVVYVDHESIVLASGDYYQYSMDKENWQDSSQFNTLSPGTIYTFWIKKIAHGTKLESEVSDSVSVMTYEQVHPTPGTLVNMTSLTLSARSYYYDIGMPTRSILSYSYTPSNCTELGVYWYSTDESVCTVNAAGIITPISTGTCRLVIRSVGNSNVQDFCDCEIHKTMPKPDIPNAAIVTKNSIVLVEVEGCEYSINNGETWQDSPAFGPLEKNSYYEFVQRYKYVNEYQPASEKSDGRVIKTLNDEQEGGTSPSGYDLGQLVQVEDIPVYCSAYARDNDIYISGDYYIYNILEKNNRIRLTDSLDDIGSRGNSIGWVAIADLQKIIDVIYVGDRVIVDGIINTNATGDGKFITKNKAVMYVTNIIEDLNGVPVEYPYEVANKAGLNKIGYAKAEDVRKYI